MRIIYYTAEDIELNDVCMVGRKPPVSHPHNCRNECPYGYDRSYCFPCYAKIMAEQRAKKQAAANA